MKKRDDLKPTLLELEGSLKEGVSGSVRGEGGKLSAGRETVRLPAHPETLKTFNEWQTFFETKAGTRRPEPTSPPQEFSDEVFRKTAKTLEDSLNNWLKENPEEWETIRTFLERQAAKHSKAEVIGIIINTDDGDLWRLPWSAVNWPSKIKAELAFSPFNLEEYKPGRSPKGTKVRILAVFGDNKGINTDVDRLLLQAAPQSEIRVLPQPKKEELFRYLLNPDGWHIFFFAGHSRTDEEGEFQINQKESLTIGDLKNHLKVAIKNGLQLAIFNSCDGIGLAKDLAELNLPQSIVMRLPVPDEVAQRFLERFLELFAKEGKSLYAAVYETRGLLAEQFGKEYPGVEWLPMICQNPAAVAGSWQEWTQAGERFRTLMLNGTLLLILLPIIGYGLYPAMLDRSLETVGMKQVTYEYEVPDYSSASDKGGKIVGNKFCWKDMKLKYPTENCQREDTEHPKEKNKDPFLYEGDSFRIRYTPNEDSYIYVYHWSDGGKVYDFMSLYNLEHHVNGRLDKTIPPSDSKKVPIVGTNKVCVLAFDKPNPYLDNQVVDKKGIVTRNSQLQYYLWNPKDYLKKRCLEENMVTFENKGERP